MTITNSPGDGTPETLRVYLAGRNKHGSVTTGWDVPTPQEVPPPSFGAGNATAPS